MDGPRPLFENELGDFISFLNDQLRPGQGWSIADEYPLAITDANRHNVRVVKSEEGFVSAAVLKPLIVRSPAGLFKVGAIGSVVTSPAHRNQGLSRQVLDDCIHAARATGCDFAILWTNLHEFYRKLGFELAGTEVALRLGVDFAKDAEESTDLRFVETAKVDPAAILRLYAQHTAGSVRTAEDIRRSLSIPNARVFTAWDTSNRLEAFAVIGKGADLDGYVHEWGGGVSKLIPLLRHMGVATSRELTLIAPAHAQNIIRRLKAVGATETLGVLGMIKILNVPNLLTKVKKYARAMNAGELVLEPRDGRFYLGRGEDLFSTDAETDLVKLIFGPVKASRLGAFNAGTADVMERVFPIPMWVWGWDSV